MPRIYDNGTYRDMTTEEIAELENQSSGGAELLEEGWKCLQTFTLEEDVVKLEFLDIPNADEVQLEFLGHINDADNSLSNGNVACTIVVNNSSAWRYNNVSLGLVGKAVNTNFVWQLLRALNNVHAYYKPAVSNTAIGCSGILSDGESYNPITQIRYVLGNRYFKAGGLVRFSYR